MWPTYYIPRRRGRYPQPVIVRTVYTTTLYPIEAQDGFQSEGGNPTGAFGKFCDGLDEFNASFSVVSGEIRDVLQRYEHPDPDSFQSAFAIVSGSIRSILVSFDAGYDSFASGFGVVSGSIQRVLITYDHPDPDNFQSSFSIVSGELT